MSAFTEGPARRALFAVLTVALSLVAPGALAAEATTGPAIDLPDEHPPEDHDTPEVDPIHGRGAGHVHVGTRTVLGGYGELHFNWAKKEGADPTAVVDLHRLVLFVGHAFNDAIRFAAEIEVEHALISDGGPGEVAIEQAYVDWDLIGHALTLRAGALLVPMGRINRWHEPPIFLGVERPNVDRRIIPTTWTEAGIGLMGEAGKYLRWEAYLVSGLDPAGFSMSNGLRGGRQKVAEAMAKSWALAFRAEVEPILGLTAALSGYAGRMGRNLGDRVDATGAKLDLAVPVGGLAIDATFKRWGLELNAQLATFFIGDTAGMRRAVDADGVAGGLDVASQILGGYLEAGFDVLSLVESTEIQLIPFLRFEHIDTAFKVTGRPRTAADRSRAVNEVVVGLQLEPIPQLAFKTNVIFSMPGGGAPSETRFDAGLGFMF
ncbi:MAG: hypothetical protein R3F39_11490 [Myxococcota bacterium]